MRHKPTRPGMTGEELRALPPAVDIETAAQVLGIGRSLAYELARNSGELARRGPLTVDVIRIGRTFRVGTAQLMRMLGHQPDA